MREVRPGLWRWVDDGVRVLRAVVLVLVGVLFLGACGGDEKDAADTSAASATAQPASRS